MFAFKYKRRGQTTVWDAIDPGMVESAVPDDKWSDGEVRFEHQGNMVTIHVFSEEAVEEQDPTPAEELANDELKKGFPGHSVKYPDDEDTP